MENTSTLEPIKYPTSAKELRILYDVSSKTWRGYIASLGIPLYRKKYLPDEVEKIIARLGRP
jgi:hypothetical protein